VWKDESHDNRNHTRKTDDSSVYETGEGSRCSSRVRLRKEVATPRHRAQGTLVGVAEQLALGAESVRRWLPRLRPMLGM
jgi:hypothetical protein